MLVIMRPPLLFHETFLHSPASSLPFARHHQQAIKPTTHQKKRANNTQSHFLQQDRNMPPLVEARPTSQDNSLCHTEEVLTPSSTSSGANFFDSIRKTPGPASQKKEKNTEYVLIDDDAPTSCPTAANGKSCTQPLERKYLRQRHVHTHVR